MSTEMNIIWLLAVGLGLACLCGYLMQRIGQSPIIGYLFAGFLIGPNSPGFVADTYIAEQLAIIGVTLLMFAVGLSFNWKDLIAVKNLVVPGALIVSFCSILAGTFYSMFLGEIAIAGLVIGLAICVSSTVVIVRVLTDQGILHTKQGHIVMGWTIVEDLIAVLGLLVLPALVSMKGGGEGQAANVLYGVLWVFTKIGLLALFVHYFGEKIIESVLRIIARTRSHELFTLAILTTAFLIAIGSSYLFGVSLALGAFIAGTIVGKTDMSHQAAANALPMRDTFAVIFFLSVGMLFNPKAVLSNLPLFFGILCILLVLRPILSFALVKVARYPTAVALSVGLAISQIGEYSFILAEEGSNWEILPDNAFDILVASAFVTIILNPFLFKALGRFCKTPYRQGEQELPPSSSQSASSESIQESWLPRAVIVGYGPVGQEASKYLKKRGFHVVVVDQNIDTIGALKEQDIEAFFGDATQLPILDKAQLENAELLVITTPDLAITQSIILTARNMNPFIRVVARTRFKADLKSDALGAVPTVCDEIASSDLCVAMIKAQLHYKR